MRFLFLTPYFPPEVGAPPIRLGSVARALVSLGEEVEIVTGFPNYPLGKFYNGYNHFPPRFYLREEWEGLVVHRVWLYPALGFGLGRMVNYGSFALTSLYPLRKIRSPHFLFVETPPPHLVGSALWYRRFTRAGLILNVADPWTVSVESLPFFGKIVFTPFLPPLEKTAFRKADFITAVTRGIYDLLKEEYKVPEEKLLYLPNGVDLKTFTPLPPDLSLKEELGLKEKVVLLYGGNLGYFQGWEVLLKTMTLLRDTPFHLLIVGGGSQGKEVKKRVMEEGMKNVTVLPPVPPSRMARLYSFSLLGLVTLRNDTGLNARPAKLFSIMACGKPVLYCGGGEGAKIVEEVGCGWVLPSDSPEKLASAIHWFYLHPEESSVMGERGRRYVEEFLSWEVLVKNWLTNFKEKAHLRGFLSSS